MADNSLQNGTDTIATDDVTTLNGGASSGIKVQRVKVGYGTDNTLRDVDAANGLPVLQNDVTSSGSLAAAATFVTLSLNSQSSAAIQITGTWAGTIQFEVSNDGTNWTAVNAVAASTSYPQPTTIVNGFYRLTPGGALQLRANMTIFSSGSASVVIRASSGTAGIFANQILPTRLTDGASTVTIKPASTAAVATDLPLVVTMHPSTALVPVTGPITDTQIRATPLPIAGTSSNAGTTVVTGNNHLTAGGSDGTNLRPFLVDTTGKLNVIGAFFQATQPVSATALPLPTGASTETTLAAINTKVTAVNTGAVTISTALPAGANTIGAITNLNLDVALSTRLKPADTLAAVTIVGSVTAITNALPTGTNSIGTTQPPAITKGTQGTVGVTTQDLKDAGRNAIHYYTLIPVLSTATDTLQSLTGTKGGATVAATATPAVVTTGKTFRVTRMAATYIATAVSGYGLVRLRAQPAGVVTITSNIYATIAVGAGAPTTANATNAEEATLAEGLEFASGFGVGISVRGFAGVTGTAVGYLLVSLTGYEY